MVVCPKEILITSFSKCPVILNISQSKWDECSNNFYLETGHDRPGQFGQLGGHGVAGASEVLEGEDVDNGTVYRRSEKRFEA